LFFIFVHGCLGTAVLEAWSDESFVPVVVPDLLESCAEFVAAKKKKVASTTTKADTDGDEDSRARGALSLPPIAEVRECLGAAWAGGGGGITETIEAGTAWVSTGAMAAAQVLAAATKIGDQMAVIEAATRLARRSGVLSSLGGDDTIATTAPTNNDNDGKNSSSNSKNSSSGLLNSPGGAWQELMKIAVQKAEEGASAGLREKALDLVALLLSQAWTSLDEGQSRACWRARIVGISEGDKIPSVRSRAAAILMDIMA